MKRILNIIIILLITLTLTACFDLNNYTPQNNNEVYAPSITLEENEFINLIEDLKPSNVAITSLDSDNKEQRASGVIVKKESKTLSNTYYVITVMEVAFESSDIKIYIRPSKYFNGTLLNPVNSYEPGDEVVAVLKFEASEELPAINLIPYPNEYNKLITNTIFSIGTPVSNGYFNYVTNPAAIMGIRENIIVHGTNLNYGDLGSPLYLKETGMLIGINIKYSTTTSNNRPEVLVNQAIIVNRVIELVEGII
ncbi:MAG: hypothetical protein WC907_00660 [Acholeplasmataceae bacterium]